MRRYEVVQTGAMRIHFFFYIGARGLIQRADGGRPMRFNPIGRTGASMTDIEKLKRAC
jgi:hypothetical protein